MARPRLGLPYTILVESNVVRLVCGEDFRYTLTGPGLERWLPQLLNDCTGRQTLDELLGNLDEKLRAPARDLLERLRGERVLVAGSAADAHAPAGHHLDVEGSGALASALRERSNSTAGSLPTVALLCQDTLDYEAAMQFNRRCLRGQTPWLWASSGALSRGYVGPVFLPGAGPCLACLLGHFKNLSPAPEIYNALQAHARAGQTIVPVPFPDEGCAIIEQVILWKLGQLANPNPPAALYRLHVLEIDSMELDSHRVLIDPECPECGDASLG